jgi:hypothetical protein
MDSMQAIIKKIVSVIDILYTLELKLHVIIKITVNRKI